MKIRSWKIGLVAALCGGAMASAAFAQTYPSRPLRFIVPFPAGGSTDLISRATMRKVSERLGQPIVVENRAGASGTIGVDATAKSAPDGYTVGLGTVTTLCMQPHLQRALPYDPVTGIAPVSLLARGPFLAAVFPGVPAQTLGELVAYAKANPGRLNFGSIGPGSLPHFAGEQFKSLAGVQLIHVPYKGNAPALVDLMAGQIQIFFDQLAAFRTQNIDAGKVRILAVAGPARLPQLPAVPTAAEAGLPGFDVDVWFGMIAPAGTPPEILARLAAEVRQALQAQEVKDLLFTIGNEGISTTPEEFAALIRSDLAKWARVIQSSGFRLE